METQSQPDHSGKTPAWPDRKQVWAARGQLWAARGARLWQAIVETARETWRHFLRACRFVAAKCRVWQAGRNVEQTKLALGKRLGEIGQGDAQQRARVVQLQEQLRNAGADRKAARPIAKELNAEEAALASLALRAGTPPTGSDPEFRQATAAAEALASRQRDAEQARLEMQVPQQSTRLKIVVGYFTVCLALFVTAWGMSSGSDSAPQEKPVSGDLPVAPSEPGPGPEEPPPGDPVEPAPALPPSQPVLCLNCNGTGQADCIQCFGTGKKTCFNCNGTGQVRNPANNFLSMQCFQCNGTGKQNCSFCLYGKTQCLQCGGSGHR